MIERIRIATEQDAADIAAIYAHYVETSPITFETAAPDADEMRGRIAAVLQRHVWLVLERDGRCVAYSYASKHRDRAAYQWSVDTAVYIHRDERGKGYGRSLYTRQLAFLRAQGYYRSYAGITMPNQASVGLHESFGYKKIAQYSRVGYKLGSWHDVGWWELELLPPAHEPKPALSLDGLGEQKIRSLLLDDD
jgi:L-amino acid N-acyltransferase YncA